MLHRPDLLIWPDTVGALPVAVEVELTVNFDRAARPDSAFGNGVHHCPGALLAQTQLQYKAAVELIRAEFRGILGAINDGKES